MIVQHPDPVLAEVAREAIFPDDGSLVRSVVSELNAACRWTAHPDRARYASALAAPQVGRAIRVFVLVKSLPREYVDSVAIVNPEIVWRSDEESRSMEGCLSLRPEVQIMVPRPVAIRVRYCNEFGREMPEELLTDRVARVFQHEFDHLDGRMITHYQEAHVEGTTA